jgi:CMP-N-acetylneuraminic acid synthetase
MMDEPQLFTSNSGVLILDETELQDIDYPTDWKLAELKYKMINDIS